MRLNKYPVPHQTFTQWFRLLLMILAGILCLIFQDHHKPQEAWASSDILEGVGRLYEADGGQRDLLEVNKSLRWPRGSKGPTLLRDLVKN